MRTMTFLVAWFMLFSSCQPVPITGRKQLSLIPDSQILALSYDQYDEFLRTHEVVEGTSESRMVQRVGENLQNAVTCFFENRKSNLEGYLWEFNLVKDSTINAFCMPGGKVVINTGILPVAGNDTGLAVVMSHEIAHAVAEHGNERMSQGLLVQLGGMALSEALSEKPAMTRQLALAAFGAGAQVGILLPYSRLHESEADRLGLIFMALAGYDPHAAVDFWKRMTEAKGGAAPPEFLSTHPSDRTRIKNIEEDLGEAMKYFRRGGSSKSCH